MAKTLATAGLVLALAAAFPAQAVVIATTQLQAIPAGSASFTYAGLDGDGTTLGVSQAGGGLMNPISGAWPGLWLGSHQESGTYTFTFNHAVDFVQFYITAQSTLAGAYSEIFNAFTTNAPSTASFTSQSGTAWDGSNLTSTIGDGRSFIRFTSDSAAGFTSISFAHLQTGNPNGSVIQEIQYDLAGVVPEPGSWALLLTGLGLFAGTALRRRS